MATSCAKGNKPFLCGVVEGFYGRPWSTEQRLDLFNCMSQWTLNCYLYAPKDDDKHRSSWRELYLLEEADHLAMLIKETKDRGIEFVYAIAPGLDITFSDDKEVVSLKRKLEQVLALGCNSFAILFDDIDPDLSSKDAKVYSSAAHAQVTITNDLYSSLGEPQIFLFCPTEYCGSRAVPSVKDSPYLNYIGENLRQGIDIMWTGPKVISKSISISSIEEVSSVLHRPPVIWDNLHANDYDQRRLFLGPYHGRSTLLYSHLNGVLTNPNCEYGANYIPIHTLAQWKKSGQCYSDRMSQDVAGGGEGVRAGETEEEGRMEMSDVSVYNPTEALEIALHEWMNEFLSSKRKLEDYGGPAKDSKSVLRAATQDMEEQYEGVSNTNDKNSGMTDDGKDRASSGSSDMDTTSENIDDSIDSEDLPTPPSTLHAPPKGACLFTIRDLRILVDLYYLPHIHGKKGSFILEEFGWLKKHAVYSDVVKKLEERGGGEGEVGGDEEGKRQEVKLKVLSQSDGEEEDREEEEEETQTGDNDELAEIWLERALRFHNLCEDVNLCFDHLTTVPNRSLLYDLYQYMSAARETTALLDSYISWLEAGGSQDHPKHKPHSRMGGIVAEMLRLLPSDEVKGRTYLIRPYREEDKDALYKVCLETGDNGNDGTHLFSNFPELLGDRYVGPYLHLSSDLCYVLEDRDGPCGYILSALDSLKFYRDFETTWLPIVTRKYPVISKVNTDEEQKMLQEIHSPTLFLPNELYQRYPSHLHIDIMKRAQGLGNGTSLIKSLLIMLKEKGSCGVHLEMSPKNKRALQFYLKLGFNVLDYPNHDCLILGKVL
ncbi:PREDICTED: protein O-GlcNAcase-like isoform X1 [Amphimedon queenslandica]|uniref:protein O-GlcNAcase n=1 Tax=Amphimedon queenslandica TaxID=400682 RepID=A0AAN0JJE8_AMPQE|nr:PREDICTED: protein O-GlcNAcase-like isoform X1 [Amphimedon queenslandica]|eukprot:XP_019856916.1 PREDICTED: protein O-GlcNAcase-like isoform X1 [Amphimedon queenslandica]